METECLLRSASDKITQNNGSKLSFGVEIQAIAFASPSVLLQTTAPGAADTKELAKASHLHPEWLMLKRKSRMCASTKPKTSVRGTGEGGASYSHGVVLLRCVIQNF